MNCDANGARASGIVLANCTPGEITFLALTSYFDRSVIAGWASGTGAAGLVGALSYAALTRSSRRAPHSTRSPACRCSFPSRAPRSPTSSTSTSFHLISSYLTRAAPVPRWAFHFCASRYFVLLVRPPAARSALPLFLDRFEPAFISSVRLRSHIFSSIL